MSKQAYPHSLHIAQNDNVLFVVADADVDAAACELHGDPVDGRVAVVVGEEHLGLDDLRSVDTLFDGHRVGLVAGQESHVDVLDVSHLRDVLCVAGNVDAEAVEGEDIAVVTSFGMELLAARGGVIGWHCVDEDVGGVFALFAVLHNESVLEVSEDGLIDVDARGRGADLVDGGTVEVVFMLVGDKDDVSLGEGGVVGLRLEPMANGVYLDLDAVVVDLKAGVLDAGDGDLLTALGGELVGLPLCGSGRQRPTDGHGKTRKDEKERKGKNFFHVCTFCLLVINVEIRRGE